ncbi:MAG: dihydrodipicolinate synthase family protein [Ardenticatenia bacterium]|nr:dihydrodipicolinate synthase family protein [Ardenticatenia bacterium]
MTDEHITSRLHGIMPAAVTPARADGELDLEGLAANVRAWRGLGLRGYLVLGSTGELPLLSELERMLVVEVTRREVPDDQLLIVGTGLQSTRATVEFTRRVADVGADAALVVTPNYYISQLNVDAFVRHYTDVADASPIPVLLYSVPSLTGVTLPAEAIIELAQHPNIVGIKDSSGSPRSLHTVRRHVPDDFAIFSGSAVYSLGALADGAANGLILAIANVAPELCVALYRAVREENLKGAQDAHQRLMALHEAVAPYGVGGIKAAVEARGWHGGPPRAPLAVPDDRALATICQAVAEFAAP